MLVNRHKYRMTAKPIIFQGGPSCCLATFPCADPLLISASIALGIACLFGLLPRSRHRNSESHSCGGGACAGLGATFCKVRW